MSHPFHFEYSFAPNGPQNLPEHEISALLDLYESTDGEFWYWHGNGAVWNFTAPNPCADSWQGVTCSAENNSSQYLHVLNLQLYGYFLNGWIPDSIGNLTELQELDLSYNNISASIPNTIGTCTNLSVLILYLNALTGALPESLSNCTQLTSISVYGNAISGTLPATLGTYSKLTDMDLSYNYFTGPIPIELTNCTKLLYLYLEENWLTGSIPDSISNCAKLSILSLSYNFLTGSIPSTIGQCTTLTSLSLERNQLIGNIPDSLGQCALLSSLSLFNNRLSGSIPNSLGQCTELTGLSLYNNALNGTIPDSLGNCSELYYLYLENNKLTGSIPRTMGRYMQMFYLDLSDNQLTNTIPSALGNNPSLIWVDISNNALVGTVPDLLRGCLQLFRLYLSNNSLSGTIPGFLWESSINTLILNNNRFTGTISAAIDNMTYLLYLYLQNNLLTGTIPDAVNGYGQLFQFGVSGNQLSGPIPSSVFVSLELEGANLGYNFLSGHLPTEAFNPLSDLKILFCNSNQLSGALPETNGQVLKLLALNLSSNYFEGSIRSSLIYSLSNLNFLFLDKNTFSGTIPPDWSRQSDSLGNLYLDDNNLQGPIPESIGRLSRLQSLNLSYNHLSGTIPTTFTQLASLRVLMLHANRLWGDITQLLNASSQVNLTTVQLSGNELTGTLPSEIFQLPALASFAAVSNCIDGTIPAEAICRSHTLRELVLDGLYSAAPCRKKLPLTARGVYLNRGSRLANLPDCLLLMPNLTTLHLAGNELTGSLPSNISSLLFDLSVSHNFLTGTIPDSFLGRNWVKLDLSYNRLTGTLNGAKAAPYDNATQLYLEHNRLSGKIPSSMQRVGDLAILESNMFSCNFYETDLPDEGKVSDDYECGSDNVDHSLYVWLGLMVVALASVACMWYHRGCLPLLQAWWQATQSKSPAVSCPAPTRILSALDAMGVVGTVAAAYCTIVLVPLFASAVSYSATFTFRYAWTLSGAFLSGDVVFAVETVFLLLLLALCEAMSEYLPRLIVDNTDDDDSVASNRVDGGPFHWNSLAQRGAVYSAFLAVNLVIVGGVNVGYVLATLEVNGRILTVCQVILAMFKLGYNNIAAPEMQRRVSARLARGGGRKLTREFAVVQLLVLLINNIVIPCVVVAFLSPNCFSALFKPVDKVTSEYSYSAACTEVDTQGTFGNETLKCDPSDTVVALTSYQPPFTYSYQCSSSFLTAYVPALINMCIFSAFLIPAQRAWFGWLLKTPQSACIQWLNPVLVKLTPRLLRPLQSVEEVAAAHRSHTFDATQLIMTQLTYLSILLTFGALFPPLAVCCAVAMASVAVSSRLFLGRYLSNAAAAGRQDCIDKIDISCREIAETEQLQTAITMILVVSCWFYALFLFDSLGYEEGLRGAYWVLIVMYLLPVVVLVAVRHAKARGLASRKSVIGMGSKSQERSSVAVKATTGESDAVEMGNMGQQLEWSNANPLHSV